MDLSSLKIESGYTTLIFSTKLPWNDPIFGCPS